MRAARKLLSIVTVRIGFVGGTQYGMHRIRSYASAVSIGCGGSCSTDGDAGPGGGEEGGDGEEDGDREEDGDEEDGEGNGGVEVDGDGGVGKSAAARLGFETSSSSSLRAALLSAAVLDVDFADGRFHEAPLSSMKELWRCDVGPYYDARPLRSEKTEARRDRAWSGIRGLECYPQIGNLANRAGERPQAAYRSLVQCRHGCNMDSSVLERKETPRMRRRRSGSAREWKEKNSKSNFMRSRCRYVSLFLFHFGRLLFSPVMSLSLPPPCPPFRISGVPSAVDEVGAWELHPRRPSLPPFKGYMEMSHGSVEFWKRQTARSPFRYPGVYAACRHPCLACLVSESTFFPPEPALQRLDDLRESRRRHFSLASLTNYRRPRMLSQPASTALDLPLVESTLGTHWKLKRGSN
ncbi:hypothetical protein B0H14DRAFT_3141974, partial [Mycena olivaceomarginata]